MSVTVQPFTGFFSPAKDTPWCRQYPGAERRPTLIFLAPAGWVRDDFIFWAATNLLCAGDLGSSADATAGCSWKMWTTPRATRFSDAGQLGFGDLQACDNEAGLRLP
jgi:hypothetical protein